VKFTGLGKAMIGLEALRRRSTMRSVPFEPYLGLIAVVGALLAFSALLFLGLAIVRLLKLPQDPPEGAYFSPSAPPIADVLSPAEARARAAATALRWHAAHAAHLAQRAAVACMDFVGAAPVDRRPALERLAQQAKTAAETADTARKADPIDHAVVRTALRQTLVARREARTLMADQQGAEPARRKRLLLMLGILLTVWALAMLLLTVRR